MAGIKRVVCERTWGVHPILEVCDYNFVSCQGLFIILFDVSAENPIQRKN